MDTKKLRQKILDLAIRGKLVPQDPNDEPASVLLERIRAEKERLIEEGKIKRPKKSSKTTDTSHYQNVPFEIPDNWEWTRLGDITNYGITENVDVNSISDESWILELEDLEKDSAKIIQHLTKKERDIKGVRHSFHKGDILYSKLRTYLNKVLVAPEDGFCTTEIIPIPYSCFILSDYLNNVLRSGYFLSYTLQCGYGVKMPRLSTNDACNGFIPLPPYNEQKRIVSSINQLFNLIDSLETNKNILNNDISKFKIKILDIAIRGKLVSQNSEEEPAIKLLQRVCPDFIPCDTSHYQNTPFDLPSNWLCLKHNEVLEISGGSQPAKSYFKSYQEKGYIRLYQIRDYGESPIPVYIPESLASKTTKKGDILLARYGGSLGKVFIAEDGAYNVAMAKVVFKYNNLINREYAYYYYLSKIYQEKLKAISRTAQAGFNSADFEDMYFPLPPYDEQLRIVNSIHKYYNVLDNISTNL